MRFGVLHGVSSLFYLVESLLGLVLVWKLPGSAAAPAASGAGNSVAAGQANTAG